MKNKAMSLVALLIAAVFAFAFKAEPIKKFAGNQFTLPTGANPNNPLAYVPYTGSNPAVDCPQREEICIIDVSTSDLYTEQEAEEAGNPALEGKPKVTTGTPLATEIADALDPLEPEPYVAPSGNVYYQRIQD